MSRRSVDHALWALWWDGHWVPEQRLRALLRQEVERQVREREAMLVLKEALAEGSSQVLSARQVKAIERKIKGLSDVRLASKLARTLRRRVGRKEFSTFAMQASAIAIGTMEPWADPSEWDAVTSALGVPADRGKVRRLSEAISPAQMRAALDAASWSDLQVARDELRVFQDLAKRGFGAAAALVPEVTPVLKQLLSVQLPLSVPLVLTLAWLALKQSPDLSGLAQMLSAVVAAFAAGKPESVVEAQFADWRPRP